MSYPVLYEPKEKRFDHNGLGILSSCIFCEVTEDIDGFFELSIKYPTDGIHFEKIVNGSIIKAKADQYRNMQLFRVYFIKKTMNKTAEISARHIYYDTSEIPVSPFVGSKILGFSPYDVFNNAKEKAVVEVPFSFTTDIDVSLSDKTYGYSIPCSFKSYLLGKPDSIKGLFGGEYEFDNYTIKLHKKRGKDNGVSVIYGKNLINIKQEENCANVITGIYPYWNKTSGQDGGYVELPEKVLYAQGKYDFQRIKIVDFSQSIESEPSQAYLRKIANEYIDANNIGKPAISLTVSFVQLEQWDEYKHLEKFESVQLYDTVSVEFLDMGVSASAIVSKFVYDSISEKIKSVSLGSPIVNIADTIVQQKIEIDKLKRGV